MELPSCKDIGGEESAGNGFCPVDYYVPIDKEKGLLGDFGFIAGCVWGDDSSWKIEYLDLSQVEKGIIKREHKFGYIELPRNVSLKQAIDLEGYMVGIHNGEPYSYRDIEIATIQRFEL